MRIPADTTAAPPAADVAWILDRLQALCAVDTTTGREDAGLPALLAVLRERG